MTVAAIICEYNPFHNGHKYQIDKIRKDLKADYIIAIMSGDFVERGEPAVFPKEIRTKMALQEGIDAVLELPLPYAVASADLFSYGAVSILNRLNCVDYLVFGSECGDIDKLNDCAKVLSKNGTADSVVIKDYMKQGYTFAKARAMAFPGFEDILSHPNNVLALEYINALNEAKSCITPVTFARIGEEYHETELPENTTNASASAIRSKIYEGNPESVHNFMPIGAFSEMIPLRFIEPNDFSGELYYKLLSEPELTKYLDVSKDLENRIKNMLPTFTNLTAFVEALKVKNLTYARIMRALLHIFLNITGSGAYYRHKLSELQFVRLLGFKKDSSGLLSIIKEKSDITPVTKVPDVIPEFNKFTKEIFELELFASTIYDKVYSEKYDISFIPEYSKKLMII